jgi:hypothetical protein
MAKSDLIVPFLRVNNLSIVQHIDSEILGFHSLNLVKVNTSFQKLHMDGG